MSEVFQNDKVKFDYKVFICVDSEVNDMWAVIREYIKFGYKKVQEFKDNSNTIIILSKEKEEK